MSPIAFLPGMSGGGEMLIIFLVVLLLFGAKRIPHVARTLARGLHEFRKASREIIPVENRARSLSFSRPKIVSIA